MVLRNAALGWALIFAAVGYALSDSSRAMPTTAGETLTGQRMVLADAVRGHRAVVVAGFSHDAGDGCGAWVKALHADAAMSGLEIYQMASLEKAPGFIRGTIKRAMKKGVPPADQDHFVVLTEDENAWRSYFDVTADKEPYVVLLDASGKILWHRHGSAADLEPQLRSAAR